MLCVCPKRFAHRQGESNAAAATQGPVETPARTAANETSDPRRLVNETGCGAAAMAQRMASGGRPCSQKGRDHRRTDLHLALAQKETSAGSPARGPLPPAHQSDRRRPGQALAILYPTDRGGGGLQEPQGGPGFATGLPSERRPSRGAHFCGFPGLLPARDLASLAARSGAGTDTPLSFGKVRRRANDRCPPPHQRWPSRRFAPLHTTGTGTASVTGSDETYLAGTATAQNHTRRNNG